MTSFLQGESSVWKVLAGLDLSCRWGPQMVIHKPCEVHLLGRFLAPVTAHPTPFSQDWSTIFRMGSKSMGIWDTVHGFKGWEIAQPGFSRHMLGTWSWTGDPQRLVVFVAKALWYNSLQQDFHPWSGWHLEPDNYGQFWIVLVFLCIVGSQEQPPSSCDN